MTSSYEPRWRKSSYSGSSGHCVEVAQVTYRRDWRKSSYSGSSSDCVEVAEVTYEPGWHKSSHSGSDSACVEVAEGARTLVRDTKNRDGGHLAVSPRAWAAFVRSVATR